MAIAQKMEGVSPKLLKVGERARKDPEAKFTSLAHLVDEAALSRGFHRLRKDAAVGVDGITKDDYGQNLEQNVRALHGRLKAGKYRHQPIRRVHIPKAPGKTRPIGISTTEDKLVQHAVREVLEAIYEQDFYDCSYGFRPGRSAHDAIRAVDRAAMRGEMNFVLEADIQGYFDSIDRKMLMEMLRRRVADTALLRLVGKCLHVGVLDGEEYVEPEEGTAQGSVLSPMLGNVYLHYALDEWFHREVRPKLRGKACLVRYADDFIIGFERRDDAERVKVDVTRRMEEHGLKLHPEKTRLLSFKRPGRGPEDGGGTETFDFLGFTAYWRKTRGGGWMMAFKTRTARLRRAIQAAKDYCRSQRHRPVKEQHAALSRRIAGHMNYFGVNGNVRALSILVEEARRAWHKWLNRRSQRARLTWERFTQLLKTFPLPAPSVRVQIWARTASPRPLRR